jgi:transcriptional regulator with XRE-family HTH domain
MKMNYANAIKVLRAARGISQRQLAEMVGCHSSYMSLIETNDRAPSISILSKIALALDIPSYLISILADPSFYLARSAPDSAEVSQIIGRAILNILAADNGGAKKER